MLLIAHYVSLADETSHISRHETKNRFTQIYHNNQNIAEISSGSGLLDAIVKKNNTLLKCHSYQLILESPEGTRFLKENIKENKTVDFNLPKQSSLESHRKLPYSFVVDNKKMVGLFTLHNNYKLFVTLYHETPHYHTKSLFFWLPTILVFIFLSIGFSIYIHRTRLWNNTIDYGFRMTTPNHSIHKFNTYQPLKFDQSNVGREFNQLAQAFSRANYQLYSKKLRVGTLVSRLKRLVSQAPLPIVFMNKDGKIIFTNERFDYVFMISMQKKTELFLQSLLTPIDEQAQKVMESLSEQNLACSINMNQLHTDQTYQLHLMPWFSTYGQLQGFTVSLNDITPLNAKIEHNIKLVNKQSTQLKEFDKLWSVIGHELRTPLSGILGMLELFNTDSLNPEQKETFETLENTSQAMLFMLNDMLDLAKLDAGKLQISLEKTDALQLCSNICDLMVGNARRQGIDLLFYFDPDAVRFIQTDASRLSQILMNLIGNAIKFTTSGYVALIVSMKEPHNDNMLDENSDEKAVKQVKNHPQLSSIHINNSQEIMQFEVVDTGIGIDEQEQTKLFSFFNQANNDISKKFGGTGLGLAISRNFSQLLGGEVVVESEKGVGSQFQLQLPVSKDYKQPTYQFDADLSQLCMVVLTKHEINRVHFIKLCQTLKIVCIIEVVDTTQGGISSNHTKHINQQLQEKKYAKLLPILLIDHGILRHEFNHEIDTLEKSDTQNAIIIADSQFSKINNFKTLPKILVSISPERSTSNQLREQFDSFIAKPMDVAHLVSELVRLSQRDEANSKVSKLQHSFNEFMSNLSGDDVDYDSTKEPIDDSNVTIKKSTILVAEDNAINRKVVAKVLEKMGYPYIAVSNGQEALEALITHREEISMVLMDCRMPVLNGLEATKQIRASHNSIPIIALTANNTDEDRKACLLVGMDNFMTKPIKQAALKEMFNRYAIR